MPPIKTPDNNTTRGWYRQDKGQKQHRQLDWYTELSVTEESVYQILMAYASVVCVTILPIPDILGLDETARLNNPAKPGTNWTWQLVPD